MCVSFAPWSSFIIFDYVLGWVYEKYTTLVLNIALSPELLCLEIEIGEHAKKRDKNNKKSKIL